MITFLQQKNYGQQREREGARKETPLNFLCYVVCLSFCNFKQVISQSHAGNSIHLNTHEVINIVLIQTQSPSMQRESSR